MIKYDYKIDKKQNRINKIEQIMRILNDKNEAMQKLILNNKCTADEKLILEDKMYENLLKFQELKNEKENLKIEVENFYNA